MKHVITFEGDEAIEIMLSIIDTYLLGSYHHDGILLDWCVRFNITNIEEYHERFYKGEALSSHFIPLTIQLLCDIKKCSRLEVEEKYLNEVFWNEVKEKIQRRKNNEPVTLYINN